MTDSFSKFCREVAGRRSKETAARHGRSDQVYLARPPFWLRPWLSPSRTPPGEAENQEDHIPDFSKLARFLTNDEDTGKGRYFEKRESKMLLCLQEKVRELETQLSAADSSEKGNTAAKKELPMLVNGLIIAAQHDTGAEGNIISKSLAQVLGLSIQAIEIGQGIFQLANGKIVRSIGRVYADCTFALDKKVTVKCWFNVWETVAGSGMIMGRTFLKATKTLSSFRHRLRNCVQMLRTPMLREISSTTTDCATRLLCHVDGNETYVNPDTGSDLDIMSWRYANAAFYEIDTSSRRLVQLGDGTFIETIGQIHDIRITLGKKSYYKTFNILPNIASDIILGETTLEELKAYTMHEDSFEELDLGLRNYEMNLIVDKGPVWKLREWFRRRITTREAREQQALFLSPQPDANILSYHQVLHMDDHREMRRRDEANQVIAQLSLTDPAAADLARSDEQAKLKKYDADRLLSLQAARDTGNSGSTVSNIQPPGAIPITDQPGDIENITNS